MFGPGLESDTKGLVRQLLWDSTSPFEVTGMFPGQFDGINSFSFSCNSNPEKLRFASLSSFVNYRNHGHLFSQLVRSHLRLCCNKLP